MSMIKLIYSDSFDTTVDCGVRTFEDPGELRKQASTVFGVDYSDLAPDKDHVGIHLTAIGASERYGANRNKDAFTKRACIDYHPTFVKYGHVYRHHKNKDPQKSLGTIKASAYNDEMDRIELFIHANKEKAKDELARLDKTGEVPFSMSCKVAFDTCSICGTPRKDKNDPDQCEHVLCKFGELLDDGREVFTYNPEPYFFDISFVSRPADRIAWNLKVAANEIVDSVKLASAADIWVPDCLAIESASGLSKLAHMKKIAEFQDKYVAWMSGVPLHTHADRYLFELRKAASARPTDEDIEMLRRFDPDHVFEGLAKAGIVLDASSFFKYACGLDYGELAPYMPATLMAVRTIFPAKVKMGECQTVCNQTTFDVADKVNNPSEVEVRTFSKLASALSITTESRDERIIDSTMKKEIVKFAIDTRTDLSLNGHITGMILAEKYAAYKVAAVDALLSTSDTDKDTVYAIAAAQNLIE